MGCVFFRGYYYCRVSWVVEAVVDKAFAFGGGGFRPRALAAIY
jgi:hypothetical protein